MKVEAERYIFAALVGGVALFVLGLAIGRGDLAIFSLFGHRGSPSASPFSVTRNFTLDAGDTLHGDLVNAGATSADANAALDALAKVYDIRLIGPGMAFSIVFETPTRPDPTNHSVMPVGRLLSVAFWPSVERNITIARAVDGSFGASDVVKQLVQHHHRAGATIDSSLYLAATQAGIPTDVVIEMIHMFSYKVDFQRDLKPGDSFEVYYDYYYTPEGLPAKQGNIAYAMMRTGGKEITLYRFQPDPNQPADYFDAHGEGTRDGRKLSGSRLRDFLATRINVDAVLSSTPLEGKVANGGSN